ncbi:metallophosphoesterase [Salipaludibacillus agaradhaerens]|uniref:Metallophosphoesterase n=1 Tax=Salipaludibacillus agaradhaerens TaxID=76935 RepID=A0A9Q4B0U7_SALAG|nr:metallophosphoesterase [Salipaludibacillus agaradhaerens]MCR6096291.1 metallophosphoesterase [Salipaludibacillus agaradhaerens]MCR6114150.1 metallophosphoesterase [Salipaludibacillus agaradhaerens]
MILFKKWMLILIVVMGVTVGYIYWENSRVVLTEETIFIEELPEEFEGFKILQITDLHGKMFGSEQRRLVDAINDVSYDAIVFTGDMLKDDTSTDYAPTYQLLEGLSNLDNALFVTGNTDPHHFEPVTKRTVKKDDFIEGMIERGIEPLDSIYTISRGESKLFFTEFEISLLDPEEELEHLKAGTGANQQADILDRDYLTELFQDMTELDNMSDDDVLISLYHYPLVDQRIDYYQQDPSVNLRDYDLHIAGHYHGGQIRLPFIGALIVPEAYYDNYGLFPPQDRVMGLWEYDGIQQYVSTGLGASDPIKFLGFRFLNPPEINLLTLSKK